MLHNLFEVTPLKISIDGILSVHTWANLEMTLSVCIIIMSFAQKKYDNNFSHKGVLGFFGYISLVFKTTYAFSVLWDGIYVSIHPVVENARPYLAGATFIIATQQLVHLLSRMTMHRILTSRAAALLSHEMPPDKGAADPGIPNWVLFMIDTAEWAHAYTHNRFRRH